MHWLITGTISLFGAITVLYDNLCILSDLHFNGKMVMGTNKSKVSVNKTQAAKKKKNPNGV